MLTHKKRRVLACLLAAALSGGLLSFGSTYAPAKADTLSDLRQQYESLQKQQQNLQQQINSLGSQVQAEKQKESAIGRNVTLLRRQVAVLNSQIDSADKQLAATNRSIASTQKRIAAEQEEYKQQACTLYEAGPYYQMEMLLTSQNVSSFLTRLQILNNLSDHTNGVVTQLKADTAQLGAEKASLQASLQNLQGAQGALAAKQTVLNVQLAQQKAVVQSLASKKASVKSQAAVVAQQAYETDAQINAEIAREAAIRAAQLAAERAAAAAAGGSSGSAGASGGSVSGAYVAQYAEGFEGSAYVFGCASPSVGFDCSGLTQYVYANAAGIALVHSAEGQSYSGSYVSRSNLQPGDLVFFATGGGGINHVGIYIGGGMMVNAERPGVGVVEDSINSGYWSARYVTARRIL